MWVTVSVTSVKCFRTRCFENEVFFLPEGGQFPAWEQDPKKGEIVECSLQIL